MGHTQAHSFIFFYFFFFSLSGVGQTVKTAPERFSFSLRSGVESFRLKAGVSCKVTEQPNAGG